MICLNSETSDSPQKLSNSNDIILELNYYVAAVYEGDRKVYIRKVSVVDQTEVNVSFFEYKAEIFWNAIFAEPRKKKKIWVELKNFLCILPAPLETKQHKKFNEDVLVNANEHSSH